MNILRILSKARPLALTPLVLVPFLTASGCSTKTRAPVDVTLTNVAPASATACPGGGTTVTSGVDTNGNGVLDASEVTSTQNICDGAGTPGASGSVTLVTTTPLAVGNANCPGGGTEIQTGLDNGAGGGTANDGILQSGEVTSTQYVCNGIVPTYPSSTTPPMGTGSSTIDVSGGASNSTTGASGNGGNVNLYTQYDTLGGNVKVFATGSPTATVTAPTLTINAGTVPFTVAANTSVTLKAYPTTADGIASTDAFFYDESQNGVYANQAGAAVQVTGLVIDSGATLTLDDALTLADLEFPNDVSIAATATLKVGFAGDGVSRNSLNLSSSQMLVAGAIDAKGSDSTTAGGGSGGGVQLSTEGTLVVSGTIDASGGAGSATAGDGGSANEISVSAEFGGVYTTGALTAVGGASQTGSAGGGGYVDLELTFGNLGNSGTISVNGAMGSTSGSAAGSIEIETQAAGDIVNLGALTASGASCYTTAGCSGSNGGSINIDADGGRLVTNAALDASGGAGQGTGTGGVGGQINLFALQSGFGGFGGGDDTPAGNVEVGGSITAKGGAGANAGTGGNLTIGLNPGTPLGQEVILYGYTTMTAAGGTGGANGGGGGELVFQQGGPQKQGSGPAGGIIDYTALSVAGGAGSASGGSGGYISMTTQRDVLTYNSPLESISLYGPIDLSGAASTGSATGGSGGTGGYMTVTANYAVTTSTGAAIKCSGGAAASASGSAGNGGEVELEADASALTNAAAISCNGASDTMASSTGGYGGYVGFAGSPINNTGAVSANGGNVASGGSGGEVAFTSSNSPTVSMPAPTATAGTATGATAGQVVIDGVTQ